MATPQAPVSDGSAETSRPSVNAGSHNSSAKSEEQSSPQPRYASYKQYLDENAGDWPELKWMQAFMNTPSGDPDDTRVTIIDSTDGSFHRQSVPVTDPNHLSNILDTRGSNVQTRIILVDYKQSLCIDRGVVDTLGRTFDIDPLVFQEHFHHSAFWLDKGYSHETQSLSEYLQVAHLASQYRTKSGFNLQMSFHNFTSAAMMLQGGNLDPTGTMASTIILWTRLKGWDEAYSGVLGHHPRFSENPRQPPERIKRMDARYEAIISQWTPPQIATADGNLTEYAASFVSVFLRCHAECARNEWSPDLIDDSHTVEETVHNISERLEALTRIRNVVGEMNAVSRSYCACGTLDLGEMVSPMAKASSDLDNSISGMQNALVHYERLKREELSDAQLEEARKSTQTAISVARLTKLAFIFIPLNFVTSFFGMNMTQFGTGGISLWVFFITAPTLICITLIPFIGKVVSRDVTFAFLKLANISLRVGFWFFAFSLFHTNATNQRLFNSSMLYLLNKGRTKKLVKDADELEENHWAQKFDWRDKNWYRRFWLRKVVLIMTFVHMQVDREEWAVGPLDKMLSQHSWWITAFDKKMTRIYL
ncbi:hypothetical protein BKA64DRAFT_648240 [Cadophora sp. MPI-SDFR-AT-0126]|nr:hypothetical protein BKA64DRAFT_648240 [Leotiomycetes sp. MPI-SDFR-AT-0126]